MGKQRRQGTKGRPTAAKRRPGASSPAPLGGVAGPETLVVHDGLPYWMRMTPGQTATKPYVCPLCGDRIGVGEAHVVAWPAEQAGGISDRRHWHTRCWRKGLTSPADPT